MSASNVGTPDWQRGTVNAGLLLASEPAGSTSVTVTVPTNAQTLVVVTSYLDYAIVIEVKGVTTGFGYPGSQRPADVAPSFADSFNYYAVASQLDNQVTVNLLTTPSQKWAVFSQSGVASVDVAQLSNVVGFAYSENYIQGLRIMGNDGIEDNFPTIDTKGRLYPTYPDLGKTVNLAIGIQQILAAPTTPAWYLFSVDVINTSGVANTLTFADGAGNTLGIVAIDAAYPSYTLDFRGFRSASEVQVTATAAATIALRYTAGP